MNDLTRKNMQSVTRFIRKRSIELGENARWLLHYLEDDPGVEEEDKAHREYAGISSEVETLKKAVKELGVIFDKLNREE